MRLRVWTLMAIVAVIALLLGAFVGIRMERKRSYYRGRVESLAWGEADVVERIAACLERARAADERGDSGRDEARANRAEAEYLSRLAVWHVHLERTYMRGVQYPWEPIPQDPPPPQPLELSPAVTGVKTP